MKKILFSYFLVLLIFPIGVLGAEKIDNFHSEIKINEDASIDVTERIEYDFGNEQRHGIFRNIPIKYKARGGNLKLRISDISVENESGGSYKFTISYPGDDIQIKIGDADKYVTGKNVYIINYKVKRAINYFDSHDELYWNVTGTEWPGIIEESSAEIFFPSNSNSEIDHKCFFGSFGSSSECESKLSNSSSVYYEHDRELNPGSGMTVVIGLPKGIIYKPSVLQELLYILKDNWILFLPILTLIVMYYLWHTRGRDPKGRGTIIAQFDAPDGLSPAEVGTIFDEKADHKDISAQIIALAIKGYLKINRIEERKLIFKSKDYEFEKIRDWNDIENDFEKKLLSGIFGSKDKVKLSELKNKFYEDLREVEKELYKTVVSKGYFPKSPKKTKGVYVGVGTAILVLMFFIGPVFGVIGAGSIIVSGIIIVIFGLFMGVRTQKGVSAQEHIKGLKMYMGVAEKDRLEFHNAPEKNPKKFEELLPYAMALGVEKQWAEQFKDIYREQQPSWYSDPTGARFNSVMLADNLSTFTASANTALSSSPSSASGGGSGFSGGGVGGGFGGGGGGSW